MFVLIRNPVLSWVLRGILLMPFVAWAMLFVGGWWQTRADRGPLIEGRTLNAWDKLLLDGSLVDGSNSSQHAWAIKVLRRTMMKFQRKHFSYGDHQAAHGFRGQAARLLGAVGPQNPQVIPILCKLLKNPDFCDYERRAAAAALYRFGPPNSTASPQLRMTG